MICECKHRKTDHDNMTACWIDLNYKMNMPLEKKRLSVSWFSGEKMICECGHDYQVFHKGNLCWFHNCDLKQYCQCRGFREKQK